MMISSTFEPLDVVINHTILKVKHESLNDCRLNTTFAYIRQIFAYGGNFLNNLKRDLRCTCAYVA